jgi:adenine-specific DNA-methyltransferase
MKDSFENLAKTLHAEIDKDMIQAYLGMISLPFQAGTHQQAAVKIIDDRGIESLTVIDLE